MKIELVKRKPVTTLQPETRRKLLYVIGKLAPHTPVPAPAAWKDLSDEALWNHIVSQVCVMGSALPMEKLEEDGNLSAFKADLSLATLMKMSNEEAYIESTLREYKATRFPKKAAQRLAAAFASPTIVQGNRVVLLQGLPRGSFDEVREELLERSKSIFKRKSVSDLMITVGLSDNVIALDQRIVGLLNKHFGFNRKFSSLQSSRSMYLSVEDCMRGVCEEAGITLAHLDRMLFRFAGLTAIEYLVSLEYPTLSSAHGRRVS